MRERRLLTSARQQVSVRPFSATTENPRGVNTEMGNRTNDDREAEKCRLVFKKNRRQSVDESRAPIAHVAPIKKQKKNLQDHDAHAAEAARRRTRHFMKDILAQLPELMSEHFVMQIFRSEGSRRFTKLKSELRVYVDTSVGTRRQRDDIIDKRREQELRINKNEDRLHYDVI